MTRVVVVGAGIVGAACALYAVWAGLEVTVVERHGVAAGTTGAGEGNLLLSDKVPGPELCMALRSAQLWTELAETLGAASLEMEPKGGVVVARTDGALTALRALAAEQRRHGVASTGLDPEQTMEFEPHLAPGLAGGAFYPGDSQIQPALAAGCLVQAAVAGGAQLLLSTEVIGLRQRYGRVTGVVTDHGVFGADYVVNAAGTWAGEVSERFGVPIPILPRRGFVLVTEPLPRVVRHKVYSADYVANVASSAEGLETSPVIEGTSAGPVLIGASRERVGFDRSMSVPVIHRLAAQAVELFPVLATVNVIRVYAGFRPYSPDHLPVVGPDPRVAGLMHACGHEGAGIGLAPATGELISQLAAEQSPTLDPRPFGPGRLIGQSA